MLSHARTDAAAAMRLDDFVTPEDLGALERPTGEAEGLPGAIYGEAFYRLEQAALFPYCWAPVAVASELPEAGDVRPVELAGYPLLLVRGEDGALRCFANMCRHRNMPLALKAVRRKAELRCPWHGWTYGLDGALRATPNLGGLGQDHDPAFRLSERGLKALPLGQWHDLVFVNIAGNAPPLGEHLAPLARFIADYDLHALHYASSWEHRYPGNWKITVEGAQEDYHLSLGHPQLMKGVVAHDVTIDCAASHVGLRVEQRFAPGAGRANPAKRTLPKLASFSNVAGAVYYIINLFPFANLTLECDNAMLSLWMPAGASETRLFVHHYFVGDAAADPRYALARAETVMGWQEVLRQDDDFVRALHEGMALRDAFGLKPRFAPYWERAVQAFQQQVVAAIRSGEAARAALIEPGRARAKRAG